MNFIERKNITFRLIASFFLLISLGVSSYALYRIITLQPEELAIMLLAGAICVLFALGQTILILKGWKKESYLYKIAFNENKHINNVPLVAVIIGTVFGLGMLSLGLSVYFIRDVPTIKASMLAVISVGSYLTVNTIIYYIYLIMFRNREINLRDFIK